MELNLTENRLNIYKYVFKYLTKMHQFIFVNYSFGIHFELSRQKSNIFLEHKVLLNIYSKNNASHVRL